MAEEAQGPWKGYKFSKIWCKKEQRWSICLYSADKNKPRKTTSYSRYLMEVHLNRFLTAEETVDHINDIKTDDRIENLQILSLSENVKKSAKKSPITNLICENCKKGFERATRKVKSKPKSLPFCSKNCAYQYFSKSKICLPKTKKSSTPIPHGTKNGYRYHKCRCDLCKKANAEASRKYRFQKKKHTRP